MKATFGSGSLLWCAVVSGLLALATPASAQWTRVTELPAGKVFRVWANGDTIVAGVDTAAYISTDAGVSWRRSTKPAAGVVAVQSLWFRNGRLYVGTAGQGVYVSDDLGATWQAFNQGLVGGFADSQLDVFDLQVRGNNLYAATLGASVYVRNLAAPGTWGPLGGELEVEQAANVNDLALGGDRLLASAGSNGAVFRLDPGDPDWTISNLDNVGIHAGLQAQTAAWTGSGWVVGTVFGVFHSVAGQEPWSLSGLNIGPILWSSFATRGSRMFGAFDVVNAVVIEDSADDGATWQNGEVLPDVFVFHLAVAGSDLYAARIDGLWRRPAGTASVPNVGEPGALRFGLAGQQPFGDRGRLRFDMPEAGTAILEIFDVLGARATEPIHGWWSAGPHELLLDARSLRPGVYAARLTAAGRSEAVRLVHIR